MSGFISTLAFATPLALWALLALPVIWWLLRSIPPRPQEIAFPPLRILMKLREKESTADKMPWWLLLLRLALAALLILAVAHPSQQHAQNLSGKNGPMLLIIDDGWAAAKDWRKRQEAAFGLIAEASGAVIYVTGTADPQALQPENATDAEKHLRALAPMALPTDRMKALATIKSLSPAPNQIAWLADGLDANTAKSFADALSQIAPLQIFTPAEVQSPLAVGKPALASGDIVVDVLANQARQQSTIVQALAGDGHVLAESKVEIRSAGATQVRLPVPVELRGTLQALIIKGENHSGAKTLLDDTWRRKTIAVMSGAADSSNQPLLSPMHYVTSALNQIAEISKPENSADLKAALEAGLSMLILSDVGSLSQEEHDAVEMWVGKGGLLVRFSGPHLAAGGDDLLPVKLREGDRNLGSSLSWETPQTIKPFEPEGPLAGIAVDAEATVTRQLLAEPDVELSAKTWASLADGTPLITSAKHGAGRIVLFHVTANADWSNLPLTGTFAQIMQRLAELAPAAGNPSATNASTAVEGDFAPQLLLNGGGELVNPWRNVKSIGAKAITSATATAATPAGLYLRGTQTRAVNLKIEAKDLAPMPGSLGLSEIKPADFIDFAKPLFICAALLFLLDCLAALFMGGHLQRRSAVLAVAFAFIFVQPSFERARAATDEQAMAATLQTHIAYVKTGNAEIDQESEQGLKGLGEVIADRTAASLGDPQGLDIENDELVFYPLIYWPVTEDAEAPNAKALERIATYMKNGGTIFFDLRDPSSTLGAGAQGEALRRITSKLDVTPLEPVPPEHALSKSFYLLKDFPGRYEGGPLWVEAQDNPQSSGFDNVSGVIIGSNDFAAAWAMNPDGQPLYALIPDSPRQRELALRVGVNVVMYVLTGNYKTDQVHVPDILKRLGTQ